MGNYFIILLHGYTFYKIQIQYSHSGGCSPVNWLNQTSKNLTIEYLNLNFVTTQKLTPLH